MTKYIYISANIDLGYDYYISLDLHFASFAIVIYIFLIIIHSFTGLVTGMTMIIITKITTLSMIQIHKHERTNMNIV